MARLELVTEERQKQAGLQQEQESWKLSRHEIAARVHQLRKDLEAAKERYDGALFDNFTDGIPLSLDIVGVNREPYGAVEFLSPGAKGRRERLEHNTWCSSNDVFFLFHLSTLVAYEIGMLAGAIYADCPTVTIDRFERGLVAALAKIGDCL